ncbi:hypothetical protein [Deinococcus sp. S9]|uniref:hypothetical protein n=1 Tax=Deinococcus sp. S9 TaxID=2545754 RepID=UPI001055CB56|nr:hypothetical protein [Deinococcus sp. S9]TDE87366.1 hypothetical protein E0686_02415 [Deinococcus sp. S9]
MPKRIRIHAPVREPDTPSWILEVRPDPPDPGGKYEFVRPDAAAEIIAEHNCRRRKELPLPSAHDLEAMGERLSKRGWRIVRSRVNQEEFLRRALS